MDEWLVVKLLGAVAGIGRRLRRDEDPSSGLTSLRTSELFLRIARVRRNEAPLPDESVCSRRGHWRTAHVYVVSLDTQLGRHALTAWDRMQG